jgi:phosphate transport system substrate-binding protein
LVAEYLNTRGARDVQTLVKGPEDIVIEPQPPIAAVWRQIQILSHGTSSGFKALAARLELPSLGSTRTEKREVPEQKVPQGSEDAIMALGLPSSNGAGNSALEEAMMRAPIGVIEARRNTEPSPRVPVADEPAREPAAPALVSKSASGADIAMASRRITPAEITALQRLGQMDHPSNEYVIALDGLAVVINRSNRLESLSIEEIARIFSGSVTDWSELGGSPGPISIYARNAGSGTMDTFSALVLKGLPLTPTAQRIEDSRELAAAVAANRSAIGFVGMPYIGATKALGIRECGLVYQPNSFNTKTEEYPLSRRLYLYTPAKRSPEVQDFLNFVSRPIAQRVIDANGFVDLSVEPDFSGEQRRLRLSAPEGIQRRVDEGPYMSLMRSGGRLSVTLRFRSNTADLSRPDLDTRAIRDIERIQDFFRDASGKPRRITLVGFTDSVGNPDNNRALSLGRAQSVATQLRGLPVVRVLGLGSAFPVACNVTDEGRSKNRRVEIWVDG